MVCTLVFVQTRRAANVVVVVVSINTLGEHVVCINTFAWLAECTHHVSHHTHTHLVFGGVHNNMNVKGGGLD